MERLCDKCGSLVGGNVKFCPLCGEPMKSAVDLKKDGDKLPDNDGLPKQIDQQSSGYSAPQYGRLPATSGTQGQAMTTAQWVGTILLCTLLGPISLILTIVWGFSSSTPEPKRSFCKAMLIVNILMYFFAFSAGAAIFSIYQEQLARAFDRIPWVNF